MAVGLLTLVVGGFVAASTPPAEAPGALPETAVEQTAGVVGLRLHDLDGQLHRLEVTEGGEVLVFAFVDPRCSDSDTHVRTLNALADEAGRVFGVVSSPDLRPGEARALSAHVPVLWDGSGVLASLLRPSAVGQAFRVSAEDRVLASGSITDLLDGDLRAGAAVVGASCAMAARDDAPVTYTRDVAPLLAANCVECHVEGGIAPFSLASYDDAYRRARMIAAATEGGAMPPWKATRGFGHFRSERVLSDRQVALLRDWAESGRSRGEPEHALPLRDASTAEWRLGTPSRVLQMPEPYDVPAAGHDIYRYFVVPNALAAGGLVSGLDFIPGDPSVVHHAIFYVDYSGQARQLDAADEGPGFTALGGDGLMGVDGAFPIGGWAPGADPYLLPEGLALALEPGADFVFEIHYHPTGRPGRDQSRAALYLSAANEVERTVEALYLATEDISIPAGDSDYERTLSMTLPAPVELIDISPHMHYLGRSARVTATLPDETIVPLLEIADWDFRWQSTYTYRAPVRLPAGTRIEAHYVFDNSADNPSNPSSPPAHVTYGPQSTDEMCELYITYVPVDPADVPSIERAMAMALIGTTPWTGTTADPAAVLEVLKEGGIWGGDADAALASLDEAQFEALWALGSGWAEAEPENADTHALLGGLSLFALVFEADEAAQMDLFMTADGHLDRAVGVEPGHWQARLTRGVLYLLSEETWLRRTAAEDLENLVRGTGTSGVSARFAQVYLYLGELHEALGDIEAARDAWDRGLDVYPDDPELRDKRPRS